MTRTNEPLLRVSNLHVYLGGTHAVADASMDLALGQLLGVIGPNGAGKSTLLNAISGLCAVSSGVIEFEGRRMTNVQPHDIARAGVARTFQGVQLIAGLTVLENVMVGYHKAMDASVWTASLAIGHARREEKEAAEAAERALALIGGVAFAGMPVSQLAYGQQKLVELARAVVLRPKLLLLDEPTSGMTRREKDEIGTSLQRIRRETGVTTIIVEHDVRMVARMCDELVVMDAGAVIARGDPSQVLADARVREAYLGPHFSTDAAQLVFSESSDAHT